MCVLCCVVCGDPVLQKKRTVANFFVVVTRWPGMQHHSFPILFSPNTPNTSPMLHVHRALLPVYLNYLPFLILPHEYHVAYAYLPDRLARKVNRNRLSALALAPLSRMLANPGNAQIIKSLPLRFLIAIACMLGMSNRCPQKPHIGTSSSSIMGICWLGARVRFCCCCLSAARLLFWLGALGCWLARGCWLGALGCWLASRCWLARGRACGGAVVGAAVVVAQGREPRGLRKAIPRAETCTSLSFPIALRRGIDTREI